MAKKNYRNRANEMNQYYDDEHPYCKKHKVVKKPVKTDDIVEDYDDDHDR